MTDYLMLVNTKNQLPCDYIPENLIQLPDSDIYGEAEAVSSLYTMLYFANMEGIDGFMIQSGYRPFAYQEKLFQNHIFSEPASVLPAGASEHQTGLAFDIACQDFCKLEEDFAETLQGIWLKENAYRFGFILRYPKGKEHITGVVFEPWHFRYVAGASRDIYTRGLCLEEYLKTPRP